MKDVRRILCPVDLSENSLSAIELATSLAMQTNAELVFLYVAAHWLPQESMLGGDYIEAEVAQNKKSFEELRPSDETVNFKHIFVHGNPGPEIVRAAESCDMIVMSTHGQTGILRLLMGSVAEYTVRHANCPVVTCKNPKIEPAAANALRQHQEYVTDVMHHVRPIRGFDELPKVIAELDLSNETGAPVVNDLGKCIGILTKTDIQKYCELKTRFENQDPTVVDEVFETDKYGQRRAGNFDFDQVHRHMTEPVVTICNTEPCLKARDLFDSNPDIHHLVVVNESNCPIGIVEIQDVTECRSMPSGR